jgi:hypothetical protein
VEHVFNVIELDVIELDYKSPSTMET